MVVEPTHDRLDLNVLVHDVHRDAQRRCTMIMDTTEVDEAVFDTEANIAGHLVL